MRDSKGTKKRLLAAIRVYTLFFLVIAFVITCSMFLFFSLLETTGFELTRENLRPAAIVTFINVVVLSLIITVIDIIRRRYTVERPVRRIINGAEKIMQGDFSTRIDPTGIDSTDGFSVIIAYFNKMAAELSGTETLRTDFVANVSHEVNTPLAVMQNYGTMLQQPGLSEEKRVEYAKAITDASRRLADLITNILKLNRLENQEIFPEKQTYNLGEQLAECLLTFEDTWEQKGIDIETDMEEDIYIQSDPELMTLVWNNLFSNAMKFTEPGGTVSLTLKITDEYAEVQVSDTGCGISPEVGTHIFEKFYQGDTSHATQGNGLGLALVKRVVDIIGGEISVSSAVGVGSTFSVKIKRVSNGEMQANS